MNKEFQFSKKWYFPIFLYGIYICFLNIFMYLTSVGDDLQFFELYNGLSLNEVIDVLLKKYKTWSSRYLIEATIGIINAFFNRIWFIIFNIFFFILMLYSFIKLIYDDVKSEGVYVLTGIFLLFPITILYSAGWLATLINYLWPASCALYSSLLIKNMILKRSISKIQLILGIFALIYAINPEQNAAVFTVVTAIVFFYSIYSRKYIGLSLFMFVLSSVMLVSILLSPGNDHRYIVERSVYFPNIDMISLIEKLDLGFMFISSSLFYSPNLMLLILCILIFLVIRKRYDNFWVKFLSIVPLAVIVLFGFLNIYLSQIIDVKIIPFVKGFADGGRYPGVLTLDNFDSVVSYVPSVVAIIATLFLMFSIYYSLCFKSKLLSLFISFLFILGVGAGTIMGFSPPMYSYRTHTVVYVCLMIVIGFLYSLNEDILDSKDKSIFKIILLICVAVSVSIQSISIMSAYDRFY